MASLKKILIGTTIGAGVIGVITYLSGLSRVKAELESVATAMIHSLKLDGLTIRLDVKLKNPTDGSLKIKYPFVKLYHQGSLIGSSKVVNKDITLKPHGEAVINGIMFNVPATSLLSLGGGFFNLLKQKQPVKMTLYTISTIDLGWKKVPYKKIDPITLNPKTT